ncbi:hypothetical protein COY17_00515 [Candidatus Saccharibacteria bacterium CG_4_10_14_0_2_um_filter_52_9]|nr:MAG: hypothetical protein COY17_00515 [Candidatus Saccharibacteria bacterium CG_4_10_14_0_2_um_filter_52_9]
MQLRPNKRSVICFFDGYTCDSPQIRHCYEQAREISDDLDSFEKLVVGGVGKKLWRERVNSIDDPSEHPEYFPTMNHEITNYFQNIQAIQNDGLRQIAHQVIADVNLPPPLRQAAA